MNVDQQSDQNLDHILAANDNSIINMYDMIGIFRLEVFSLYSGVSAARMRRG